MAGYIGYDVGGVLGAIIAVFATVAPSLILMIILLKILLKYKNSPKVKRLTSYVRPIIAILLGVMAWDFFVESYEGIGIWQTVGIGVISFFMIERWRIHPAIVIVAAFVYGGLVLG